MSLKVLPVLAPLHNVEPRTLHLVVPGDSACMVCGMDRRRMRFHYIDEPEFFMGLIKADAQAGELRPHGFINTNTGFIDPYYLCGAISGNPF